MSGEDFGREVCALADLARCSHEQFAAAWRDIFWLNEPVVRLVADLKDRGYTLVLGSNTNALHAEDFRPRFAEALRPFDAVVLSYEVGHMKPDREFFDACANAAGVPAGDCVFIDDLPENIDGARAAGMTGLVYRDVPGLTAQLRDAGCRRWPTTRPTSERPAPSAPAALTGTVGPGGLQIRRHRDLTSPAQVPNWPCFLDCARRANGIRPSDPLRIRISLEFSANGLDTGNGQYDD